MTEEILTSAVVAAIVSGAFGVVGVLLNLIVTGARVSKDRKRETFARALAAVVAYAEFPYVVRRRRSSDREGERIRISEALREVQQDLAYHSAWIATESEDVKEVYDDLVSQARGIAGGEIRKAWDADPPEEDRDMHMPDLGLGALQPARDRYTEVVKKHLASWKV